jgi:hypothetical protein
MKRFTITYKGNSFKFRNFKEEVRADNERQAVEKVYSEIMDSNYFPQEDGSIKDCDGNVIAGPNDQIIDYDGGSFIAEEL